MEALHRQRRVLFKEQGDYSGRWWKKKRSRPFKIRQSQMVFGAFPHADVRLTGLRDSTS